MTLAWRFLLLALLCVAQARAESAHILHGGKIYTVDPARPWASAVVVRDGRIVYVGDDAGALAAAGTDARAIALNGRMVLPGFQDSHIHLMGGGLRLIRCQLKGLATAEAIYAAVRACAASDKSAWLRGSGWEPDAFVAQGPTRAKLDEIVGDRPAFLTTEDGFTAWVNSRAMAAGGVTDSNGVVTGDAYERIRAKAPKASPAQYREALTAASAMANRFGITSAVDAGANDDAIDAYHAADVANELSLRLVAAQIIDPDKAPARIDEMVARRDAVKGRRFRADAAKIFLDGEFDRRSAALEEDYVGEPLSAGSLHVDPFRTFDTVDVLHERDFLVHMHAMGDRAVGIALNAAWHARARSEALFGRKGPRHQVAHVGLVLPSLMNWFSRDEISANFQPSFFHAGDPATVIGAAALGPKRAARMYPIKSVADAGGRILISSDWPAPAVNPLEIIQYALTRQPLDASKPPLQPDQRITLTQALAAYTINPALASRSDADTGSIEVGKLADLIVLDRNLFETPVAEIHKARVLLTLLDGAPVYREPDFAWR